MPRKTKLCECGVAIRATSIRCRSCNLRIVGKPGWNRIGDTPIPGAQRTAQYRQRYPDRAKECSTKWKVDQRKKVNEYKAEHGCEDCGITDHRVLDLHHRDREDKIMAVSEMRNKRGWAKVKAEMDKCRVLCANCHRIRHAEEAESGFGDITAQIAATGFFRAS